jgi:CheY-like chemotaxis protein
MSKRILLVEDDTAIRDVLCEVLAIDGYETVTAANGQEGLDKLVEGPTPDLILLDLMMPVKDGFSFRLEQRQNDRWKSIPVVILSANANLEERFRASGDLLPFLKKPVDLDLVLATVRNVFLP